MTPPCRWCKRPSRTGTRPHLGQPRNAESRVISVAKIGYVRRPEFRLGCAQTSARSSPSSRVSRPGLSVHSRNNVCKAGTTTSMMTGPISMPPTTTVANGRCTWLPIPEDSLPGRVVHGGNRFHATFHANPERPASSRVDLRRCFSEYRSWPRAPTRRATCVFPSNVRFCMQRKRSADNFYSTSFTRTLPRSDLYSVTCTSHRASGPTFQW